MTPSGDDFVAGVLAALVWLARVGALDGHLPAEIRSKVDGSGVRTNRISSRLLHYAGEGVLYAPAMELGAALLAGDAESVREPVRRLLSIGHTSGADLATGLLVGCLAGQMSK